MALWQIMGWLNVILVVLMGAIYPVKEKMRTNKKLIPLYRKMRIIHPVVGVLMILVGSIHGYVALGEISLHSGSLILLALIAMALIALAGQKIKAFKKGWRKVHRTLGILVFLLVLAHLIFPWWL